MRLARRLPVVFLLLLAFAPAAQAQRSTAAPAKQVIILVGMPGTGKTTAADMLSAKLGARKWTSGDVIRNTIKERGLEYNAENDRAVAEEFGKKPGEIGRRIAAEVAADPGRVAVVEGFRTPADLAEMRKAFPGTHVVAIEVGAARRYERMLVRGRAGEDNVAYLKDRDRAEVRRGVREVMRQADIRIRPRGNDMKGLERSLERVRKLVAPKPQ